ncbi:class I SAM-dependent methyltransferase [Nannocystaceae bacterium ST9]
MPILSVIRSITRGYSPAESAVFDRFAPTIGEPLWAIAMDALAPQLRPGLRVLDVGCGGAHFAMRLLERCPELELVGVDLSPEQIARARARTRAARFVEGDATDLRFADGEFDLVYSLGSLKHWPDRARGLHECARVLRPGGRLWVMEGDRGCRRADTRALIERWRLARALRPLAIVFFRDLVVGDSLDVDEARGLLAATPEIAGVVERPTGMPVWVIAGRRVTELSASGPS